MGKLKETGYKAIFADVWNFMDLEYPASESSSYWTNCISRLKKSMEKYQGTPQERFAREMFLDVVSELERSSAKK